MGFWKITPFLALSILVLIQVGILQAAPISTDTESRHYPDHSPKEESRLQLADVVMKIYALKMKATELPQKKEVTRLDVSREKRCSNLSTCVLGTYTQDLNRFHTFPQTAVGVGAPGKKRFMPNSIKRTWGSHTGRLQNVY